MSEDTSDQGDKEHDASQKRLDEARARGEVTHSQDLTTAAGLAGLTLAAMMFGGKALQDAGSAGATMLAQADRFGPIALNGGAAIVAGAVWAMIAPLVVLFAVPAVAALLSLLAQRAIVFAPDNVMPKGSRISPVATARQKFGMAGLFEFFKSVVKLSVVATLLFVFFSRRADRMVAALALTPAQSFQVLLGLIIDFLVQIVIIMTIIGAVDYLWQRAMHARRLRMSRQEMVDEFKETEGDPQAKATRRQRGYDIATNAMLADVAGANVIIVNPTHYAVALKWTRGSKTAPICVAKGVDEIAARIRELGAAHGVPIHSDPPTARAIHATVKLGGSIAQDHFRAVAAAIRFAESMRKRAAKRGRS